MDVRYILNNYKKIAVVGFSDKPGRYSNEVTNYIKNSGYEVYGVNPNLAGKTIEDIKCFSSLKKIDFKVDIINIFRKSEYVIDAVNDAVDMKYKPAVIWVQAGIFSPKGRKKAEDNGIFYIENRCILVEHKLLAKYQDEK